jgi:hypothetical protein
MFCNQSFVWAISNPGCASIRRLLGLRGIRINHDRVVAAHFINWVKYSFEPGVTGYPADNPNMTVGAKNKFVCNDRHPR